MTIIESPHREELYVMEDGWSHITRIIEEPIIKTYSEKQMNAQGGLTLCPAGGELSINE